MLFWGLTAFAQTRDQDYAKNISLTKHGTKKTSSHKQEFSLVLPSFVIHGIQPDTFAASQMPEKLVANGDAVATPGIGFQYKSPQGFLALGAMIKDCYYDLAGTLQLGEYYPVNRDSEWGWTLGVYSRQTPMVCSGPGSTIGNGGCKMIDDYNWKWMTMVNGQSVDVIPMPFLHYSAVLYKDQDLETNLKLMGNFALNEIGLVIPL